MNEANKTAGFSLQVETNWKTTSSLKLDFMGAISQELRGSKSSLSEETNVWKCSCNGSDTASVKH